MSRKPNKPYVTATWLNVVTGENVVICPQDLYKID